MVQPTTKALTTAVQPTESVDDILVLKVEWWPRNSTLNFSPSRKSCIIGWFTDMILFYYTFTYILIV